MEYNYYTKLIHACTYIPIHTNVIFFYVTTQLYIVGVMIFDYNHFSNIVDRLLDAGIKREKIVTSEAH